MITLLWSAFLLGLTVRADLYMQGCRGSNNRLDERGRDRANANRLFDSQNNNRGGYNVGHLTYYTGEKVPISWTNQHGAGVYQLKETEIILQYSCGKLMRDGTTTNRIPDTPAQCTDYNCDTDVEYGRHESFEEYQYCKSSSRNKGLFTANQNLRNKNSAIYTRQDSAGTRYGYECPEERDYYPYWRGSRWRDMAIFTNTQQRCDAYRKHSQNVEDRYECRYTQKYWENVLEGVGPRNGELPLNETACKFDVKGDYKETPTSPTTRKWEWKKVDKFDIDPPDCFKTVTTRANHHGLTGGRSYWTYNWKVPDEIIEIEGHDQCCVIRARYNITTNDYQAWDSPTGIGAGIDYRNNSKKSSPNPNNDPAWLKIWENFGLDYSDIEKSFTSPNENNPNANDDGQRRSRGYVFRNDPEVDPFGYEPIAGANDNNEDHKSRILLQLAINTDQFGRTFEDRTHCFSVKDRKDAGVEGAGGKDEITLVTVQGKRGNIVQTYPATEYFFLPEPANIFVNSFVHFCWTGSNRNPNNNDGQGLQGSDRSNICPLTQQQWDKEDDVPYGDVDGYLSDRKNGAVGDPGNNYPDWIRAPAYGLPIYYNYAPKRDLPRKSARAPDAASPAAQEEVEKLGEIAEDPYNAFWFREKGKVSEMAGLDTDLLAALCTQRRTDAVVDNGRLGLFDYGNMEELDDAGTTFCIEPKRASELGAWNFICTRNNNFSNRSQKGSLTVTRAYQQSGTADSSGYNGEYTEGQARLSVLPDFVQEGDTLDFEIVTWLNRGKASTIVQLGGADGGVFNSETLKDDAWIEMWIPYTPKSLSFPKAWYKAKSEDEWAAHSDATRKYEAGTHFGVIHVTDGGFYTISNEPDVLAYIAVVVGCLLFATAMFFVIKKNCVKASE